MSGGAIDQAKGSVSGKIDMGISICIASGKGGVGKTMLAANLGLALSTHVKDVTILDADLEMSNLEFFLGTEDRRPTLHDVLKGEAEVAEAKHQIYPGINIIPAGINLDKFGDVDPQGLLPVFEELLKSTDVLIIDSPAGLGGDAVVALASAHLALLVITHDLPSISGALKTKIIANRMGTQVIGVVVNMTTTDVTEMAIDEMESFLGTEVIALIPKDPKVRYSLLHSLPFFLNFKSTPVAIEIERLASDLMGGEVSYTPVEQSIPTRLFEGMSMRYKSDLGDFANVAHSDMY